MEQSGRPDLGELEELVQTRQNEVNLELQNTPREFTLAYVHAERLIEIRNLSNQTPRDIDRIKIKTEERLETILGQEGYAQLKAERLSGLSDIRHMGKEEEIGLINRIGSFGYANLIAEREGRLGDPSFLDKLKETYMDLVDGQGSYAQFLKETRERIIALEELRLEGLVNLTEPSDVPGNIENNNIGKMVAEPEGNKGKEVASDSEPEDNKGKRVPSDSEPSGSEGEDNYFPPYIRNNFGPDLPRLGQPGPSGTSRSYNEGSNKADSNKADFNKQSDSNLLIPFIRRLGFFKPFNLSSFILFIRSKIIFLLNIIRFIISKI